MQISLNYVILLTNINNKQNFDFNSLFISNKQFNVKVTIDNNDDNNNPA